MRRESVWESAWMMAQPGVLATGDDEVAADVNRLMHSEQDVSVGLESTTISAEEDYTAHGRVRRRHRPNHRG